MSPRTREANDQIRNESLEKILMTSIELFTTYGYNNVSISQIAKKAEISQGLLYHYFKSKEELLEKIIYKIFEKMDQFIGPDEPSHTAREKLKGIIGQFFTILEQQKSFWLLCFPLITQPSLSAIIRDPFRQYFSVFVVQLKELFQELGFKNPEVEAYKLGATLDGLALDYLFVFTDDYPVQELKTSLLDQYKLL